MHTGKDPRTHFSTGLLLTHSRIAIGVDNANLKLDGQQTQLQALDRKLDMLLLFSRLDTPREKEVQRFIDDKGGPKTCIENDQLLEELIIKSGEGYSGVTGSDTSRTDGLQAAKKVLSRELAENLDDALKKNLRLFERKLEIQNKQLKDQLQDAMHTEGQYIITAILAGAHERIIDPVRWRMS